MRKKVNNKSFKAKREKQKNRKLKADQAFPRKEFNEYWKKHSDDVGRAVYEAFLDVLSTNRLYIMTTGAFGRSQRQEIFSGNVGKFCEYIPKKINGSLLREMLPDMPRIIHAAILGCDNMELVGFAMAHDDKIGIQILMNVIHESKRDKEIAEYVKSHLNEIVVYNQISPSKKGSLPTSP